MSEGEFAVDLQDESSLKMLSVFQKDVDNDGQVGAKDPFTFSIDIEKYKGRKMHIFLKHPTQSGVVSFYAPVTITLNPLTQRYRLSAVVEHIPNASGVDLTSGDWYISGFWGGGDENPGVDTDRLKHKVKEVSPVMPEALGKPVDMDIPLGFPWTPITGKQTGSQYTLQHLDLKIRPMGVLLSLFLENRTKYNVDIVSLDKEMHGFAFGGYFDIGASSEADLKAGRFPAFKPYSVENVGNEVVNILPQEIKLASAEKTKKPLYMWVMPTEDHSASLHSLSFTFVSSKRTTMDATLPEADRFNNNGIGEFTDRYVMDLAFKKTPDNSRYYIRDLKIRSGLMITEYFINRHRVLVDNADWHKVREPNFHGYVELYNPNLDPLDLENYALARMSNIRRPHNWQIGNNYVYFHPMANEKFGSWKENMSARPPGTADRYADAQTESHRALLLSLKLKNGEKSSFQPNSLGFRSHLETKNGIQKQLVADSRNDDRIERVRFIKPSEGISGKAQLSGGKTMILLGNAFIEGGDPANIPKYDYKYYTQDYYGYRSYQIYNLYPQYKFSQADWDKILNNPECEIVVAVDNYRDRSAYPIFADAGVLNLNWSDALIVVQKHPSDGTRRRIIDATSTHPFSRVNNWTEFVGKVTLAEERRVAFAHFRVRTVAQHQPEFLNFSYTQWYAVPFRLTERSAESEVIGTAYPQNGTIPAKVSPGKRSAAQ